MARAEKSNPIALPSSLLFTENKGQWADSFLYVADLASGKLLIQKDAVGFMLWSGTKEGETHRPHSGQLNAHLFNIRFKQANEQVSVTASGKSAAYRNYFIGNNPAQWKSGVGLFQKITYHQLWKGIDAAFYGSGDALKYELTIQAHQPMGTASAIQLSYEGIDRLQLVNGELRYQTSVGDFRDLSPYAYQVINGFKKEVKCHFVLNQETNTVSFALPDGYNTQYDLIIDPTIIFSSYTGATADNWGYTATYDAQSNMYVGGYVNCTNPGSMYPATPGAYQLFWNGGTGGNNGNGNGIAFACDMGISQFKDDGTQLVYSTFVGGQDNETPHSLVVDNNNNLIIYGVSYSPDYPVVQNNYDVTWNGAGDIVVTKLNAAGSVVLASTYVGGAADDGINFDGQEFSAGNLKWNYGDQNRGEVVVDAQNNIYVVSCTKSFDFPVTAGAPQSSNGGNQDGCLFKLNSSCQNLIYSTYVGGVSDDACYSLDVAADGSVYAAGGTMSNNFPATTGTIHSTYQGGLFDGFLVHLNALGTQFLQSGFLGTPGDDQVYFVKLDQHGDVYFVGQTTGAYPVSSGVYANPNSGQFIGKVHPDISSHIYSTVFGNGNGSPNISPTAFLVDTCENVYVAGWGTNSSSFTGFFNNMFGMPLSGDALQTTTDGTDFYFFVISKNAQSLLYASYFGGPGIEHVDGGTSRLDKRGVIYQAICAGCGGNSLTPTTPGVWSPTNPSSNCNLLGLKIAFNLAGAQVHIDAYPRATGCVPLNVQFQSTLSNVQSFVWYFGDGTFENTIASPLHTYTDTGTYTVMLIGIDSNSCNIADTAYLSVEVRDDSLIADFLPNLIIDCDSNKVSLSSVSYSTTQTLWNMGDGSTYNKDSISHYYLNPGTYNVTLILTDTTKCNLTDTFVQQVKIPPTINASFALSDSMGCVPLTVSFQAQGTVTSTYLWSFGDGIFDTLANPSHSYQTQGNFPVRLIITDSASCNTTDTAFANIATIDSFADADFQFERTFFGCDSVEVKVWSGYQGEDSELWNFGDGTVSTNDTASHTFSTAGTFTITHYITDANMICKPLDTAQIIISLLPLNVSITIPDTGGCLPFLANFTGNSVLNSTDFMWHFGDGSFISGDTVTHLYNSVGTFNVTVLAVDTNACVGADSAFAQITVIDDSVHADFQMNVLNDCDSNLVIDLINQSSNAVTNFWSLGDGATSNQVNENHSYTVPATYVVTLIVTDTSRCHPADTMVRSVTLKPNVFADFTISDICLNSALPIHNLSNPAALFNWSFDDGNFSNQFEPTHTYSVAGTYTVQMIITDTSTCDLTDTVTYDVTVNEQPIAAFATQGDTFRFETQVAFFSQSSNYNQLIWNFGDGSGTVDEITPIHTYETIGWKTVCLEATNDVCNDTVCKIIFISFQSLIGVPNAFSPNADGTNDLVKVEGKGIIELTFRIYNRWGELVFETHDKNDGWNGIYKGSLQEMDVFTYTADAVFINGDRKFLKGNITLLR